MAQPDKDIKIKIESTSGTLTDLTSFVTKPSFWRHPIRWIRYQIALRKARKLLSELLKIKIPKFEMKIECRIRDPWKWN